MTDPLADNAGRPGQDKLAFCHVPKTGGTSLTAVLAQGWPHVKIVGVNTEVPVMTRKEIDGITLLSGHFFPFQIENERFSRFVPVTVLRDPLARLLSAFRYSRECVARGEQVGPTMRFAATVSFAEFIFSALGAYERHMQIFNLGRDPRHPPQNLPIAQVLERAKQRLGTMIVGTTDCLGELAGHLFATYGRGEAPPVPRLNTTEEPEKEDLGLTRTQRAMLRDLLRPDYDLFEYAQQLAHERLGCPKPPVRRGPVKRLFSLAWAPLR